MVWKGIISKSLRNKLLVVLLAITLIPLVIMNIVNYTFLKKQLESDQGERLSGYSRRIAKTVDIFLNERVGDIIAWTSLETTQTALDIGGGQAGANQTLENLVKSYGNFDLVFLTNQAGTCIASSLPEAIGVGMADQTWFKQNAEGKMSLGEVGNYPLLKKLIPSSDGWSMLITVPVVIQKEYQRRACGIR